MLYVLFEFSEIIQDNVKVFLFLWVALYTNQTFTFVLYIFYKKRMQSL